MRTIETASPFGDELVGGKRWLSEAEEMGLSPREGILFKTEKCEEAS